MIEYMTPTGMILSSRRAAIEYYGNEEAYKNALSNNILTQVVLNDDREPLFDNEIENTKAIMDALMACVKDKSIPTEERSEYYKEYLQSAQYYLKINKLAS